LVAFSGRIPLEGHRQSAEEQKPQKHPSRIARLGTSDAANRFLIVRRNIVGAEGLHQEVTVATRAETIAAVQSDYEHALQVLPVGALLKGIWDKLRKEREG
jgi:hypothetical protein